jgi:glycosyltransferase involved in cell wall biosynthesis
MSKAARNSVLFRESKIVVIPNPINPVFFSKKKVAEDNPPKSNSVVFSVIAADLKDPNKRVAQVCEALRLLAETFKGINIRLRLIGSRGEHLAEKYPFVSLLGTLNPDQLSQTLDSVDVNISFSVLETSPLSIAECAARGVPTIASLNPGSAELISNLDCGTTVGDMKEFMNALDSVVKNKLNSGATGLGDNQMSTNAEKLHRPDRVALSYLGQYLS